LSTRTLSDLCIWCGEKLPDDFAATRLMHDRMCHPDYMLAQMGIDECKHEKKTHYVSLLFDKGSPAFNLEICEKCIHNIPKDLIKKSEKINASQNRFDGGQF
jgi:hypothetical protein